MRATPLRLTIGLVASLFLGIGGFAMGMDDDGFLFLAMNTTSVGDLATSVITTIQSQLSATTTATTTSGGSNGSGLNLMLMSQMNEGYCKDVLTLCAKNEAGELDTVKYDYYPSIETVLGIWAVETQCYDTTNHIPKFYFPNDGTGGPVYGKSYTWGNGVTLSADEMTVTGFSHDELARVVSDVKNCMQGTLDDPDGGNAVGPLQYESTSSKPGIANVSSKSNAGRTKGDYTYLPDQICGLMNYVSGVIGSFSGVELSNMTPDEVKTALIIGTTGHARGPNHEGEWSSGAGYCVGSSHIDKSKMGLEEYTGFSKLVTDCEEATKDVSVAQANAIINMSNYTLYPVIMMHAGWSINDYCYNNMMNNPSTVVSEWQTLFPSDNINSIDDVKSWINSKGLHRSIASMVGVSNSVAQKLYNTDANGNLWVKMTHNWASIRDRGSVYKVVGKSDMYKNGSGNVDQVVTMDNGEGEHLAKVILCGKIIYAYMLKFAGVNVDPTDASTYLAGVSNASPAVTTQASGSSGTYKPTGSQTEQALVDHGCDISKLTPQRLKFLTSAIKMDGTMYSRDYRANPPDVTHAYQDCSSFVSSATVDSKLPGTEKLTYSPTTEYFAGITKAGNGIFYEALADGEISVDKLLPGDIFSTIKKGHVFIYVGMTNGKMVTLEARTTSYPNGWSTRDAPSGGRYTDSHGTRIYHVLRLVGFGEKN